MADEIHQFTVTIPANTPITSLYSKSLPLSLYEITRIDIRVPPGPAGLMGFYLALSGQQWIPFQAGEYLVWDDHADSWPLSNQPTSNGWELYGYNTDEYDHSVFLVFHLNAPGQPVTMSVPKVTIIQSPIDQQVVTL